LDCNGRHGRRAVIFRSLSQRLVRVNRLRPRHRQTPLANGTFIADQRNPLLIGSTGTGKSHLAIAIARAVRSGGDAPISLTSDQRPLRIRLGPLRMTVRCPASPRSGRDIAEPARSHKCHNRKSERRPQQTAVGLPRLPCGYECGARCLFSMRRTAGVTRGSQATPLAFTRPGLSRPSVNQAWTGASRSRASDRLIITTLGRDRPRRCSRFLGPRSRCPVSNAS
jgi:hypothetical protein